MMPADVHDIFDGAGVPSPKDALESTGLRFPTSLTANPNAQKKVWSRVINYCLIYFIETQI
jgi:hypothetical protein